MSDPLDTLAKAWVEFAARERGEVATRIWGLWSATATPFYVFVLRPDAAVAERIALVRQALAHGGITAPVPPHFLHITVQSLGNEGEKGLTADIASDLADAVTDALRTVAPFAVRLARVGPFVSGAFIAVEETEEDHPLARMQRAIVNALLGAKRVPVRHPERFYLPHLSVCYFDAPHSASLVSATLFPFRDADFGVLPVNAIELVRVTGDGSLYPPMKTVRRIPFGS